MISHDLEERRMTRAELITRIEKLEEENAELRLENDTLEDLLDDAIEINRMIRSNT